MINRLTMKNPDGFHQGFLYPDYLLIPHICENNFSAYVIFPIAASNRQIYLYAKQTLCR